MTVKYEMQSRVIPHLWALPPQAVFFFAQICDMMRKIALVRCPMTTKLYDIDPYCSVFTAKILSCEGTDVVLDATAFFPEGGGQAADLGTLNGIPVTDVQIKNGVITHTCLSPLPEGSTVEGVIDWNTRYSRMQQHSGEHILSGIVHAMKGYDNVGFHMGADCTTVDFSGKLTDEEIAEIQKQANRVVTENRPVRAWYPEEIELSRLPYRSKKELTEAVRLVEIENTDLCACCAPHVRSTAEVGPILILGREVIHGGTRLTMLCGERAVSYAITVLEQNRGISALLSAKPHETLSAVQRVSEELGSLKLQLSQTAKELYAALAEAHKNKGNVLLFQNMGDPGKLACAVSETCGGFCAVFLKTDAGFRYAIAGENVRELGQELHAALGGKGGGKPNLVQGSVPADEKSIRQFFRQANCPK